ncbi:MAG: putative monovalent cation/H+ antiporter subunit A [Deltaproteobacteria bacterium]|nr:putative monovalent cation/H+ antiporter subunit A [Deltaproteobacteria bacterium]
MIVAVVVGFVLGLLAPLVVRVARNGTGWITGLVPIGLFAYFASFLNRIQAGETLFFPYPWLSPLGIGLSFRLDGLSLLFALLITGIGTFVCLYSAGYLAGHPDLGKFYGALFAFMASMLGLVLSDNLVALFVFWELTSVTSYLLIGFDSEREAARRAALQALLVTGAGGLALLAAFVLMQQAAGSFEIAILVERSPDLRTSPLYAAIIFLVLTGAATKSAQFPFHFWLPNAMEAPTPVSTYLHAATMVKGGVYLLARLSPVLGGTDLWRDWLIPLGTVTMLTGAWLSLVQVDLKRILAHTTVGALGACVLLIGMGTQGSLQACMVFLLAHGLYKGSLFLVAGIVDHETGTRNAADLGRLGRAMPLTCIGALLAALSSAGVYPFLGFLGKELLYESTLVGFTPVLLAPCAVAAGIAFAGMGAVVGVRPFFSAQGRFSGQPHDPSPGMWVGPVLLGMVGLLFGLFHGPLHSALITPAVRSCILQAGDIPTPSWHGLDVKLALSALSLLMGGALYWKWSALRGRLCRWRNVGRYGPAAGYDHALCLLEAFARRQTRFFQSGRLNVYLIIVICTAVALLACALVRDNISFSDLVLQRWADVKTYEAVIAAILLTATVVTVRAQSMLVAVVALGVVGYCVAVVYLLFSAPDVAMTQFAIETLSVILLMVVLLRLPRLRTFSTSRQRLRDALVAVSAGLITTLLVLVVTTQARNPKLADFYARNSLVLAKGRNVVNVILVDFRGFDTLGEITVLAVAAIGVYSLVKLGSHRDRIPEGPPFGGEARGDDVSP